jgi:hypothetical protein
LNNGADLGKKDGAAAAMSLIRNLPQNQAKTPIYRGFGIFSLIWSSQVLFCP